MTTILDHVDTLILGAGAAGLFCGARVANPSHSVLVIDHAAKPAEKVRISGGGRCNFTNLDTEPSRFLSENPHFAKSALARYTPTDFCTLMAKHGLTWHEKTLGQLFCDQKSGAVIKLLLDELETSGGALSLGTAIDAVAHEAGVFTTKTSRGVIRSNNLIVATGGLSIPKMGASAFAYDLARQFGHEVTGLRPALVPMTFSGALKERFSQLSGVALPVEAKAERGPGFPENLLFTHRGLSGPAILQTSSYWHETEQVILNLLPGKNVDNWLQTEKQTVPRQTIASSLKSVWPQRFCDMASEILGVSCNKKWGEVSNQELRRLAEMLTAWSLRPTGTEGWRTAEVTAGGVSTQGLSSKTLESRKQPGLYFIGECVDVTGWLGGYNFQWAWASAAAAAEAISGQSHDMARA